MRLTIFTPDGEYYSALIESIMVNEKSFGAFGILKGHLPIISAREDGTLSIKEERGSTKYFSLLDGVLRQFDDDIEVICSIIEEGDSPLSSKENLLKLIERRKEENKERNVELTQAENELRKQIKKAKPGHL